MKTTPVATILASDVPLGRVVVAGWVRTRRDAREFSFIELNDGTSVANLQIIAEATLPGYSESVHSLTTGSSVGVVF